MDVKTEPAFDNTTPSQSHNCAVHTAENMDTQMPRMDGVEATRRIKEEFPQVKVLYLTVHASYIEEALAAGASRYLRKDCKREEMLDAIRSLGASKET